MSPTVVQDVPRGGTVIVVYHDTDSGLALTNLVEPLHADGFDVLHGTDVLTEPPPAVVREALERGGAVVICWTVTAAGSNKIDRFLQSMWSRDARGRDLWVQMDADARLEQPVPDGEVIAWKNKEQGTADLVAALRGNGYRGELHWDPRQYLQRQADQLAGDTRYPPDLYVAQRFVRLQLEDGVEAPAETPDLLEEMLRWLKIDSACILLVLGDFGSGKSFLLRQLARKLSARSPNLVPMLVEQRVLEKHNDLGPLLAMHLAAAGEGRIDIPAVRRMLDRGQVVLLIDGLDESGQRRLNYAEVEADLRPILSAVAERTKVVLTGRTQHFRSDDQWRTALSEQVRNKVIGSRQVGITDFDRRQIRTFLVNLTRLRGGDEREADERLALIKRINKLDELSQNPRMLSFIADLSTTDLSEAAKQNGRISSADLYGMLVDRWLDFEVRRRFELDGDAHDSHGTRQRYRIRLRAALDTLANTLWEREADDVDVAYLEEAAAESLAEWEQLNFDKAQAAHALGSSSLLVRRGDRFSFIHHSMMEYLVAATVARRIGGAASGPWDHLPLSDLMVDFLCGSANADTLAAWARRILGDSDAHPHPSTRAARNNAILVTRRLDLNVHDAQLGGQDLRGRDLSGMSLPSANLSDANLAGTNLRRTYLGSADLSHANLAGATLHDTNLGSADLSHANLAGAKLKHTDLTDATLLNADLSGAHLLTGTKLVGTRVDGCKWVDTVLHGVILDREVAKALREAGVDISDTVFTARTEEGSPTVTRPPGGPTATTDNSIRYDLAISYASEDVEVARSIYNNLRNEFSVFFAEYGAAATWGNELGKVLPKIFGVQSRFVLVLSTDSYVSKSWTLVEYEAAVANNPDGILVIDFGALPPDLPADVVRIGATPAELVGVVQVLREILGT